MRTIPRLFGLLLLGLLTGLLLFSTSSCEATRSRERGDTQSLSTTSNNSAAVALSGSANSRQIMRVDSLGKVAYRIPQSVLASALIQQFHDGTVIDRVLVHQAPTDPKVKSQPIYYLVGTGSNNGHYRAIALPLRGTDDGTYYLTPNADRYVLTSNGCPTCYFDFEDGRIIGSTCDDAASGSSCMLRVLTANEIFMHK